MAILRASRRVLDYVSIKDVMDEWRKVEAENMATFVELLFHSMLLHWFLPEVACLAHIRQKTEEGRGVHPVRADARRHAPLSRGAALRLVRRAGLPVPRRGQAAHRRIRRRRGPPSTSTTRWARASPARSSRAWASPRRDRPRLQPRARPHALPLHAHRPGHPPLQGPRPVPAPDRDGPGRHQGPSAATTRNSTTT